MSITFIYNQKNKKGSTLMSYGGWTVKTLVHSYKVTLLSSKKEWTIDICNNLDGSQAIKLNEKVNLKGYILYNFINTFWNDKTLQMENTVATVRG